MIKKPFKINIPQQVLDDLYERLRETRWPTAYQNVDWEYNADMKYMQELEHHWLHQYDWRKAEAELNRFNHFTAEVDGVNIHFIHEKGKGNTSVPLLLTHGWPDSFYRYHKTIPMLTDPVPYGGNPEDTFDVIIPSIPGAGFSDRIAMSEESVADLWFQLMKGLGYEKFAAAGGDAGSIVTKYLAFKHPEAVTAIHLTDVGYPDFMNLSQDLTEEEQQFIGFLGNWWMTEGAFNMIHATKPQTLDYAINDSPVGMAAWIIEKFRSWSDFGGNIENVFSKHDLITNIMFYWLRNSVKSFSDREEFVSPSFRPDQPVDVPVALAFPPNDLIGAVPPRELAARNLKNILQWHVLERGGHFVAMEFQELLASDIRAFFHTK